MNINDKNNNDNDKNKKDESIKKYLKTTVNDLIKYDPSIIKGPPITLDIDAGTRDLTLFLKIIQPKPDTGHMYNNSNFVPYAGSKKYRITIGQADFSDFFNDLNYYATTEPDISTKVEGLTPYNDLATAYLESLIYHVYGYFWFESPAVK